MGPSVQDKAGFAKWVSVQVSYCRIFSELRRYSVLKVTLRIFEYKNIR